MASADARFRHVLSGAPTTLSNRREAEEGVGWASYWPLSNVHRGRTMQRREFITAAGSVVAWPHDQNSHLNPPNRRMDPQVRWCGRGGVVTLSPIPISRVIQRMSADVDDARLGLCLSWRLRLCRKLKHRCLLTLMQVCQENKRAIRERR